MREHWYFEGAPGWRFCFAKGPTFECPRREAPPDELAQAGAAAGFDLVGMFETAHRRYGASERRRIDGRLTDRCSTCGARMTRLGFSVWVERPPRPGEKETTSDRISGRLFGPPTRIENFHFLATKREAREWAREEARISIANANEEPSP